MTLWRPTGDLPFGALVSVRFLVPNSDWVLQSLIGAMDVLTYGGNWESEGTATPDQAASVFGGAQQTVMIQNNNVGLITAFACDKMEFVGRDPAGAQSQWYPCTGDFLSVIAFPDLYARIGNHWGGDSTVFAVPTMPGTTVIGVGTAPGGTVYTLGELVGQERVAITSDQMPAHTHTDSGHTHAIQTGPDGLALAPGELPVHLPEVIPGLTGIGAAALSDTGGGGDHENRQPSIALYWYIQVFP